MYKYAYDLKNIEFPIFLLRTDDWYYQDNVLFIDGLVVDEKNMTSETLGGRRIECGRSDLYPLKKAIFTLPEFLNYKGKKFFIDNKGMPFIYVKSYNSTLRHHKIKRVEKKGKFSLIWLVNIPYPFKTVKPPYDRYTWVRVLYYRGSPWIIYDFTTSQGKDTYRRI